MQKKETETYNFSKLVVNIGMGAKLSELVCLVEELSIFHDD